MKPGQTKNKLQLKKQAISNLSATEQAAIKAGNGEGDTTSWRVCSGWNGVSCCHVPAPTELCGTITFTITTIL